MALLFAAVAAAGASSFDRGAGAAAAPRGAGLKLKVLTSSDKAALSADRVRVQADSSAARRVELSTTGIANGPLLTIPTTSGLKSGKNGIDLPSRARGGSC